jgi:hypothetical protein
VAGFGRVMEKVAWLGYFVLFVDTAFTPSREVELRPGA